MPNRHAAGHPDCVVSLVDDDAGVREALGRLLRPYGWQLRSFASCADYLVAPTPTLPTCVVLEASRPGDSGLELQSKLQQDGDATPLVFVCGRADLATAVRAMKAGAVDFLAKPVDDGQLLAAVRLALQRDMAQRRDRQRIDELRARIATLSRREREVMRLVALGLPNKKIASVLEIAEITVKVHRRHMMDKMAAATVADLVRMVDRVEPASE